MPRRILMTWQKIIEGLCSDFDLIEGENFSNHIIATVLGAIKRKPVVCWYPDVFIGSWLKLAGTVGVLGEIAERVLLCWPGINFIAISQTTKKKLVNFGVPKRKVTVIYCGTELIDLKQVKKYDICVVSRLLPYKKIDDLIVATRDLHAVIVGQGPEEKKLKELANKNVVFLGYLPKHRDVLKVMAQSKIFCHPSEIEGFVIVIVEAMALGIPVVASNIPAISEITKGGKGALLFVPGDREDLAKKIRILLKNRKVYQQKVKEAKILARNYSWVEIAKQTEKYYENLLYH